jgi:DNA polymerase-3 subunit delta'
MNDIRMNLIEGMTWLSPHWQSLNAYLHTDRVPQALLITGKTGVGKMALAETFSQRLLCRNPGDYACGDCVSCKLYAAGTLPDFIRIEPEEAGKTIPIDAIRGLIAKLALKPQYSGRRVVLLSPAHQMNTASANSLLKTLEEPDEHTTLLLLTDSPQLLLPTILSRCQRLDIPLPEHQQALQWLQQKGQGGRADVLLALARGAPLQALALADAGIIEKRNEFFAGLCDLLERGAAPTLLAETWAKFPCETLTEWMTSWTMDLIRLRSAPNSVHIDNRDVAERLQALAQKLNLRALFAYWDKLIASQRLLAGQANKQLLLEELLIRWLELPKPPDRRLL